MDNFSVDELNEHVGTNPANPIEFVTRLFHQINASNEAVYFVETTSDLVGLIYVTDMGEDMEYGRYRISTASLQPRDVLRASQEAAANVVREATEAAN